MRFRTTALVLFYVLLVILITPFIVFCMLTGLRDPVIAVGQWAMRVSRRILGIKVEVSGLDRIAPRTALIFMPNHISFLDGPMLEMLIPGAARVVLKKSVVRIPVVGLAMRFVGFVPVDRKGAEGGKKSIARAVRMVREKGYSFLIFPEGTRSRDGKLQRFRRGGFYLALESGAPIVPVTIRGTFELMPKGQKYARKGTVQVAFHDPISAAGYTIETMAGLMEKVKEAILSFGGAMGMQESYGSTVADLNRVLNDFFRTRSGVLEAAAEAIARSVRAGGKVLVFGNGGSAAEAQHFTAELVNGMQHRDRPPIPAIALTTDTSSLTAIGNDRGFALVFSRQVEALGRPGDVAIALTTSGTSPNVVEALKTSRAKGLVTIAFTGEGGGAVAPFSDYLLDVPSRSTPRIQEAHLFILHLLAERLEKNLEGCLEANNRGIFSSEPGSEA